MVLFCSTCLFLIFTRFSSEGMTTAQDFNPHCERSVNRFNLNKQNHGFKCLNRTICLYSPFSVNTHFIVNILVIKHKYKQNDSNISTNHMENSDCPFQLLYVPQR